MYCFIMAPWPFATKIGSGDRHLLSSLSASAWSKRPHQKHNLVAFMAQHMRWTSGLKVIAGENTLVDLLNVFVCWPFLLKLTIQGLKFCSVYSAWRKKYISTYVYAVSLMFVALVPSQNLSFTEVTPRRPSFFDRNKKHLHPTQPSIPILHHHRGTVKQQKLGPMNVASSPLFHPFFAGNLGVVSTPKFCGENMCFAIDTSRKRNQKKKHVKHRGSKITI